MEEGRKRKLLLLLLLLLFIGFLVWSNQSKGEESDTESTVVEDDTDQEVLEMSNEKIDISLIYKIFDITADETKSDTVNVNTDAGVNEGVDTVARDDGKIDITMKEENNIGDAQVNIDDDIKKDIAVEECILRDESDVIIASDMGEIDQSTVEAPEPTHPITVDDVNTLISSAQPEVKLTEPTHPITVDDAATVNNHTEPAHTITTSDNSTTSKEQKIEHLNTFFTFHNFNSNPLECIKSLKKIFKVTSIPKTLLIYIKKKKGTTNFTDEFCVCDKQGNFFKNENVEKSFYSWKRKIEEKIENGEEEIGVDSKGKKEALIGEIVGEYLRSVISKADPCDSNTITDDTDTVHEDKSVKVNECCSVTNMNKQIG